MRTAAEFIQSNPKISNVEHMQPHPYNPIAGGNTSYTHVLNPASRGGRGDYVGPSTRRGTTPRRLPTARGDQVYPDGGYQLEIPQDRPAPLTHSTDSQFDKPTVVEPTDVPNPFDEVPDTTTTTHEDWKPHHWLPSDEVTWDPRTWAVFADYEAEKFSKKHPKTKSRAYWVSYGLTPLKYTSQRLLKRFAGGKASRVPQTKYSQVNAKKQAQQDTWPQAAFQNSKGRKFYRRKKKKAVAFF